MGKRNKVSNYQKVSSITNPSRGYSSGIYYGKVVSVKDKLNEGRIKVKIMDFDKNSKPFCRDIFKNKNQNPKRVQGTGADINIPGLTSVTTPGPTGSLPLTNPTQKEALANKPEAGNIPEVNTKGCTEIPYAVSLLPKHLQVMPKEGEACLVIIQDVNNPQNNRFWVGPLMSDKSKMSFENSDSGGDNLNLNVIPKGKQTKEGGALRKKGNFPGGFPEPFDVAIMGRNNADIILPTKKDRKDSLNTGGDIMIRAGKFEFNNTGKLRNNTINPGFLRIKVMEDNNPTNPTTHSMLYSDYISIVSYKNSDGSAGAPFVRRINPVLKSDSEMIKFHNALSPLVRGDKLIEFLELLRNFVKNHNHPYPKLAATNANSKPEIDKFDLISILSPHIRIN